MKVRATVGPDGKITRGIDLREATLPDGRSIQGILDENQSIKAEIVDVKGKLDHTSSILTKFIPNKTIRNIVEVLLILGTIIPIGYTLWPYLMEVVR